MLDEAEQRVRSADAMVRDVLNSCRITGRELCVLVYV